MLTLIGLPTKAIPVDYEVLSQFQSDFFYLECPVYSLLTLVIDSSSMVPTSPKLNVQLLHGTSSLCYSTRALL